MARKPRHYNLPLKVDYPYLSDRSIRRLAKACEMLSRVGYTDDKIHALLGEHSTGHRINVMAFGRDAVQRIKVEIDANPDLIVPE